MPDFIPRSDAEFDTWTANFVTYVSANFASIGLTSSDVTDLTTAQTDWNTKYPAAVAAQNAATSAVAAKDASRQSYMDIIRAKTRNMQGSGEVDASEAAAMGLTVRDTIRTPVGAPTVAPVGDVDTSNRLRHIINFRDPTSSAPRAKPSGVEGCEIWVKIGGTPPADPSELHYLATDTRTPYSTDFDGAEGGQMAHYMLRWVSTRHEPGPWSETVSATITG